MQKNFGCKFDREIFEALEEFCDLSGQSKTTVVERAVKKYLDENLELDARSSKEIVEHGGFSKRDVAEALDKFCEETGRTKTKVVELAINEFIKRHKREK